jgi:aspartate 1-decarboxylase
MVPFERVDVFDGDNGNRFSTALIRGERGSGDCCVNGAAARLVEVGHKAIVVAYASIAEADVPDHRPRVVLVEDDNSIREVKDWEGAGVRVPFA